MFHSLIKKLSPELRLMQYNQIPVLELDHAVGQAKIALQGAQLLSWKPAQTKQDVFWLSEVEPFEIGNAIRGGVPLCYPWFGGVRQPSHGTARIRLWNLSNYVIAEQQVRLVFQLFDDNHLPEAKLEMQFGQDCQLTFTHYGEAQAQVALHSYFRVSDIKQIEVQGLPTECYNSITKQQETASSPRQIQGWVDCIYNLANTKHLIVDKLWQRQIHLEHHNASNLVLWNPWHTKTSSMSEVGYKTMICLETARITHKLQPGESVAVRISLA